MTPELQSFDVMSTSSGRKYGHLDVIQKPGNPWDGRHRARVVAIDYCGVVTPPTHI